MADADQNTNPLNVNDNLGQDGQQNAQPDLSVNPVQPEQPAAQESGQSGDQVLEPELLDVTQTPQYKEYEAQQVAGSGLNFNDVPAAPAPNEDLGRSMLEDNPSLVFSGPVNNDVNTSDVPQAAETPKATEVPVPEPEAMPTTEQPVTTPQQPEVAIQEQVKSSIHHNKKSHIIGIMLGFLGLFLFLSVSFSIFLILPTGKEFLAGFGYGDNLAYILVMIIFGLFGVVSLVGALLGTFKLFTAKKEDRSTKKAGFVLTLIASLTLIVSTVGFILGYSNFGGLQGTKNLADLILTQPEALRNLTAPVEISFDASGIPYDAENFEIISYQWDFTDGSRSTGARVSHTFDLKPDSGVYNVKLTITYRNLTTGEQTKVEIIKPVAIANQSALAKFTMTPDFGAAPLKINFDASGSSDPDGEIVAYEWDFDGDGVIDDEGEKVEFTYQENGKYDVTLSITDTNGEVTKSTRVLELQESGGFLIAYQITPDEDNLRVNLGYQFDASISTAPEGKITSYTWNFGDNTPEQKGVKVTHSYKTEGIYTLKLTVKTDNGKEQTKEFRVQVGDLDASPVAVITSVPAVRANVITGIAPLKVSFSANNSTDPNKDIVGYEWDFDGNGVPDASGANSEHTFQQPGTYTTVLTVEDADGNRSTAEVTVNVNNRGVTAALTASPVAGETPLSVTFDASATTTDASDPVVSFEWDFGDGSTPRRDNAQITYVYRQVGTYTAKVTAITASNKRSSAQVAINANPVSLKACFTMSRKTGDAPLIVQFSSKCARGVITSYKWNFGDGSESIEREPVHTFAASGEYKVTLTVEKDNILDTFTDTVIVR